MIMIALGIQTDLPILTMDKSHQKPGVSNPAPAYPQS